MAPGVRPRAGWDSPAANMAGAVQGTARRMRAIWQSSEPLMSGAMPPRTARPKPEPEPEDGSREPPLLTAAAHSLQFNKYSVLWLARLPLGPRTAHATARPAPFRSPPSGCTRTPNDRPSLSLPFSDSRCKHVAHHTRPLPISGHAPLANAPAPRPRRLPRPALRSPAPTRAAATTLPAPPTPHCSAWPPRVIGGRCGYRAG